MNTLDNWIRKSSDNVYYGYATPGTNTSDAKWMIRRVITDGTDTVNDYACNDFEFDKIWDNKADYFTAPTTTGLTFIDEHIFTNEIHLRWNAVKGARISVSVKKTDNTFLYDFKDKRIDNFNLYLQGIESKTSYIITFTIYNGKGSTTFTKTYTTL